LQDGGRDDVSDLERRESNNSHKSVQSAESRDRSECFSDGFSPVDRLDFTHTGAPGNLPYWLSCVCVSVVSPQSQRGGR